MKRIVDEEMRFTVIVNGNSAQKELFDIEKANRGLVNSNKDLRAERAKLIKQGKKNTQEYKNLTTEISKNNAEITKNKSRMSALQKQIGVTGLTMRQLQQRASHLRLQLLNMVPGSAKYKKYEADLKQINTQLFKLRSNGKAAQGSLSKLANGFNKYAALGASAIAVLAGWVLSVQKMIDFNGKLSDSISDVQKTTGLTKEEVDDLAKSFGVLKTRTSRINLLKIAEEGGRIGILKEDIGEFVEVMNKAAVALGDSFPGGAEEVATKLGKLKFLFKETKDLGVDLAFNAIGSSINELGASGNATELNIADFTTRVGALPDALKPAIGDTLALGAAFEESGIKSEISARAYSIFLTQAATNTGKFAKVMGVSQKEVEELINTNPLEFFLQFTQGLQGLDATEIAGTLKFLGVNATGATKAIGAAANNQKRFRELLTISNEALVDATSLTNEYDIKNNNLAATLDKVKKKILGAFTSESVVTGLSNFVEWFAKFIGASDDADGSVTRFRNRLVALLKSIIVITAAIISYRVAVQLAALWTGTLDKTTKLYILTQKVATATTTFLRAATLLLTAAFNLVTLNITRARAAMILFNRSLMLSPIGLIVAAIGAAVAAYYLFSEASEQAVTKQSLLNDVMAEADKQTAKSIKSKELLLSVARDETQSLEERKRAIDELNRVVPEYNNQLSLETVNTLEAKAALDKHIQSMKQAAITHALSEKIKAKAVELSELENASLEGTVKWYEELWNTLKNGNNPMGVIADNNKTALKNKAEVIEATKAEIEILEELYRTQLRNNPTANTDDLGPKEGDEKSINGKTFVYRNGQWTVKNPFIPPAGGGSGNTKIDQAKKEATALLKLQRETEDKRIALIENAFLREMTQNDVNQKRRLQDLQNQSDEVLAEYDKAISSGDTDLASILLKKYNELYDQIELIDEEYQNNRNGILNNGIEKHIKSLEEQYQREEEQRQIAHNNALAALGDNERAKEALEKAFQKDKLLRQKQNQELLVAELKKILGTAKFEDFNLELLTEEQLQTVKDRLQSLGLSLSEINKLLAAMKGDDQALGELAGIGIDGEESVDILGMNDEQWSKIFERFTTLEGIIGKVGKVVSAAAEAYSIYDQFVSAGEQKRLNRLEQNAQKEIEKQGSLLRNNLITKKQHDDAVKAQEDKVNKAKAEMEYKQAKRQKQINIATILGNQAVAISKALAQGGFILGIPWAAIVGAFAGLQLALAIAQPLPAKGFEQGFYNNTTQVRREQDGKLFDAGFGGESRSGVVDKPTVFLAGEGGRNFPELIISGPDYKRFDPELKNALNRQINGVRGFEGGYYKNQESADPTPQGGDTNGMMMSLLSENIELLRILKDEGIQAYMSRNFANARRMREDIKKLDQLENKSKINT